MTYVLRNRVNEARPLISPFTFVPWIYLRCKPNPWVSRVLQRLLGAWSSLPQPRCPSHMILFENTRQIAASLHQPMHIQACKQRQCLQSAEVSVNAFVVIQRPATNQHQWFTWSCTTKTNWMVKEEIGAQQLQIDWQCSAEVSNSDKTLTYSIVSFVRNVKKLTRPLKLLFPMFVPSSLKFQKWGNWMEEI